MIEFLEIEITLISEILVKKWFQNIHTPEQVLEPWTFRLKA